MRNNALISKSVKIAAFTLLSCVLFMVSGWGCDKRQEQLKEIKESVTATQKHTTIPGILPLVPKNTLPYPPKYSMFSWKADATLGSEREALLTLMKNLDINALYQNLSSIEDETQVDAFLYDMEANGIAIYGLTGAPGWAIEVNAASLINYVDSMYKVKSRGGNIKGIVFDVEPRQLDEWDEDAYLVMKQFANNMIKAYNHASQMGFEVIICIPASYDEYEDSLTSLIAKACDGIAIMNYRKFEEFERMEKEVEIARRYKKTVINISELQAPGLHGLKDSNTYHGEDLDTLLEVWDELYRKIDYEKLQFSYHYYEPLKAFAE